MNIENVMLSGDRRETALAIARHAGIDQVHPECLPQDKINFIKSLQRSGKRVAMVGDGINDAPSLAQVDVRIAMGTETDIAIESAGIIMPSGALAFSSLSIVLNSLRLRRLKFLMTNINQNMKKLIFKTNINCSGCVSSVTSVLNQTVGEDNW